MRHDLPAVAIAVVAATRLRERCHAILGRAAGVRILRRTGGRRPPRVPRPDVLLLDAVGSPPRALGVLPALRRLHPSTGIILIIAERTPMPVILEAIRRGARGFLGERDLARWLPKAIRTVAAHQPWISRRLATAIVAELRAAEAQDDAPARRLRLVRGGGASGRRPAIGGASEP